MGWYFTRAELCRTPSVTPEMSDAQVKMLLMRAIEFLQNTGMKLLLPQLCIATAVVYFQRFYVVHSLKKYDIFKLAAAALFLAGKVEESPRKLKHVVCTAWEMDPRRKQEEKDKGLPENGQEFWSFKEKILEHERELLRVLAFNLAVDHPYKYLLQSVKAVGGSKELARFAWNFINDSLKTNLCLQYKPQVIGCAVLDLTSKAMKVKLPGPPEKPQWWYEESPYYVTPEQVEDVCDQLLALYEGFTSLKQTAQSAKLTVGERLRDPGLNSKIMSVGSTNSNPDEVAGGGGGSNNNNNNNNPPAPPPPPPPPPSKREREGEGGGNVSHQHQHHHGSGSDLSKRHQPQHPSSSSSSSSSSHHPPPPPPPPK